MLIRIGGNFRINDYNIKNNHLYIETNVKPNFDILRKSGSLIVNKETDGMVKTAKYIAVAPKSEDFLYIRNRAISAGNTIDHNDGSAEEIPMTIFYQQFPRFNAICRGANDNGDFFSTDELKKSYKTFVGKAVFVDHNNDDVSQARGIILDAIYNEKGKFVELLKAVDKKAYPELARGIEAGYITSTSMGTRCAYSLCSICFNEAHTEDEFCDHIKYYKGSTFNGLKVWEDNRDVEFFEDSFVSIGADPQAKILERVACKGMNKHKSRIFNIANEKNQRIYNNQFNLFFDQLNNLPWG